MPSLLTLLCLPIVAAAAQESLAIRGTVTDSVHKGPLVGAKIVAARSGAAVAAGGAPAEFTGTSDSNGRFEIPALPPDVYLVTVAHPWLDSTGFEVPAKTVDLREHRSASVALGVPSGATIRAAFCRVSAPDTTLGLVEGFVRDARSGQAVGAARVVFDWTDFSVDRHTGRASPRHHTIATHTAVDGSYAVCGIPVMQSFLIQAQIAERAATGAVDAEIPQGGVLVETLRIAAGETITAPVSGTVLRNTSKQPIAGAHVHVFGAGEQATTASDGSFRLTDVPIGTQAIEVTALGLHPIRYAVDVMPEGESGLSIVMGDMLRTLDTIRTVAKAVGAPALRDEFDMRAGRGTGQYITEEMIAKRHPWQTTDLIRYVAGFTFRHDTVYTTRGSLELGGGSACKPILLIDGNPADSMNEVLPIAIHGIEIYATNSAVPIKYASSAVLSDCGAILIWTK